MKAPNVKLDRVFLDNRDDAAKIVELVRSKGKYNIVEMINKASIPEFELITWTSAKFLILKPRMEHPSGFTALVDLYGISPDGEVLLFLTLCENPQTGVGWIINYIDPMFNEDGDEDMPRMLANETMMYYVGIQYLSLERPEVVSVGVTEVSYEKTVKKKGKYKTERRTKMIRNIRLDSKELAKRHNIITCECWGVAGHWRTYKSGKQVFIHAYRKGKKRDDPNALVPKAYSISSINERKEKNNDE